MLRFLITSLMVFPNISWANNVCTHLFPSEKSLHSKAVTTLIKDIESGRSLSSESLFHLTDMVTSSSGSYASKVQTQKILNSLAQHQNLVLRSTSYDLLIQNFDARVDFFSFFKTRKEIDQYLAKREQDFVVHNQLPTAAEIISVFGQYSVLTSPVKLSDYLRTFDENGYFYLPKSEINKVLEHSPSIYLRLMEELKSFDSRIPAENLYSVLRNPSLYKSHELVFDITLEALHQQNYKIRTSDLQFIMKHIDANTKQGLVWSQILNQMSRNPDIYMNELIGDMGLFMPLMSSLNLNTPVGRMLYQKLLTTLKRYEYEMTPEELQLSFSHLITYKPMSFDAQTRVSSLLKFEFEPPVELFYNYLTSLSAGRMTFSYKDQAFDIIRHNLKSVPHEASVVSRLEALVEN